MEYIAAATSAVFLPLTQGNAFSQAKPSSKSYPRPGPGGLQGTAWTRQALLNFWRGAGVPGGRKGLFSQPPQVINMTVLLHFALRAGLGIPHPFAG